MTLWRSDEAECRISPIRHEGVSGGGIAIANDAPDRPTEPCNTILITFIISTDGNDRTAPHHTEHTLQPHAR